MKRKPLICVLLLSFFLGPFLLLQEIRAVFIVVQHGLPANVEFEDSNLRLRYPGKSYVVLRNGRVIESIRVVP